jgi:hypothetical protein
MKDVATAAASDLSFRSVPPVRCYSEVGAVTVRFKALLWISETLNPKTNDGFANQPAAARLVGANSAVRNDNTKCRAAQGMIERQALGTDDWLTEGADKAHDARLCREPNEIQTRRLGHDDWQVRLDLRCKSPALVRPTNRNPLPCCGTQPIGRRSRHSWS